MTFIDPGVPTFIDLGAPGLAPFAVSTLTSCAWGHIACDPVVAENRCKPKNMHAIKIIKTTRSRPPSLPGFLNSAIKVLRSIANTPEPWHVSRLDVA
jgi:hypothetical protein